MMIAPTPFYLKCTKCNRKVYFKGWIFPTLVFGSIIIITTTLIVLSIYTELVKAIITFAGLGIFLEITISLFICNKGTLIAQENLYKDKKMLIRFWYFFIIAVISVTFYLIYQYIRDGV